MQDWVYLAAFGASHIITSSLLTRIGQKLDFSRAYCLFVARVASFASERSEGANDATRATNKQYAREKSCYYHYHQYTRPYHEESMEIK